MNMKRAVMMLVVGLAVVALALPIASFRTRAAAGSPSAGKSAPVASKAVNAAPKAISSQDKLGGVDAPQGKISKETLTTLGFQKSKLSAAEASAIMAKKLKGENKQNITLAPDSGQPTVLNSRSALSAALMTNIGGRDNQFSEVTLIADWDGREDCAADREQKVDDFSFVEADIDTSLTRVGISEHTVANGFAENVYYYGDSLGNLWVGTDTNPGINNSPNGAVDALRQINIPALVNTGTSGGFSITPGSLGCTDDQVTVTGIAVQPVADLSDFDAALLCGTIGEVVYVSIHDSEGCSSNAANQPIRTRIFAFAFTDGVGAGAVTPAGVRQIFSSPVSNIAGVAVDDDGSLYFHLVDLIQFTGGAIFKATPIPHIPGGQCGLRSTRVVPSIPTVGLTSVTPLSSASVRVTNYSSGSPGVAGTVTPLFGNVVAIATGPCNVLYAAVSRSLVGTDDGFTQLTEGLFPAPGAFATGTPSMVISFADCSGAFDVCSGEATGGVTTNVGGTLPVGDGFADGPTATATRTVGVNDFRIFVQGNGPDLAPAAGGTAVIPGTPAGLLKVDMQIDYSGGHSGLAVNEEGTVFVMSGGMPAGIGKNPSPMFSDILCFEDMCPMDRRADFVDLRGNTLPNPPASGGNVGDGDSDKFDHLFYQAPIDQVTLTPGGLAGLARGHLRYAWRLAPAPLGPGVTLGVTKTRQGDDDTDGPIIFENLDPGHQVAGGDDQNTPFRGDDDNGAGNPIVAGALSGGFEFVFGGPVGTANCVWNGFFLNSNGNITFGVGDPTGGSSTDPPTVPGFRSGPPRIAPAWADLNPTACDLDLRDFPVQALGFANVNAFRVRWINVPEFGSEVCTGNGGGFSNTFSVTLYDDGTGIDENANQPLNPANPIGNNSVPFDLQEGPTDSRFTREPNTGVLVGCPPRREGSGQFIFEYCRMDLLGTADSPVIVGFSIGGLDPLNPPGLCESNLSELARAADNAPFGVLTGGQVASIQACLIGEGTEPTIFELFNEGRPAQTGSGGEITFAKPDFDLRCEGNDAGLTTSTRQTDLNRGKVGFFGIGCAPPANPQCVTVVASPFVTTPTTTGLVNALCAVQLNAVGCGFFPNETTIICQGFNSNTGVPLQRNGKTVSTTETLACDTNGDGIPESTVVLASVTPVSVNLVRGTIPVSATFGATSASGFPAACCGGAGTLTITTTFTSGDNNAFGPFTRVATCAIALGTRAPVVFSITPSEGDCSSAQDLIITGACFVINGVNNVTSVFAVEVGNPNNRINGAPFVIQGPGLIDAFFNFGTANAGKTFLIFVSGPNGTSRNLTSAVAGAPAGCPLGNEQGVQVTFRCRPGTATGGSGNAPVIDSVTVEDGSVIVTGRNFSGEAVATINGTQVKKMKFKSAVTTGSSTSYNRLILKKNACSLLNGNAELKISNPNGEFGTKRITQTCQ